ncbi:hypothetical protein CC2G_007488 [Coprinopsis cinerea AmutBmut pab1-1]|nr:hypothetical protein CC2G_007488 [Coprinopsis cinerea AmutBmut pab1-1]
MLIIFLSLRSDFHHRSQLPIASEHPYNAFSVRQSRIFREQRTLQYGEEQRVTAKPPRHHSSKNLIVLRHTAVVI